MAYENVNVESAKSAINSCLNSLNYNTSSNIISELSSNADWEANSKDTFKKALETLTNTRYKELEDYLKKCLENLDKIAEYKKIQSENASVDSQIGSYRTSVNMLKNEYNRMPDKNTLEAKNLKNRINNMESNLNSLNSRKSNNANKLQEISNSIDI